MDLIGISISLGGSCALGLAFVTSLRRARQNRLASSNYDTRHRSRPSESHRRSLQSPVYDLEESDASPKRSAVPDTSEEILDLLSSIADDQTHREGSVHRGITCNMCNINPIRGVRYKCANCVDWDVCEACESHHTHTPTHVFLKVTTPLAPLSNQRTALLARTLYPSPKPLNPETVPPHIPHTHFDPIEQRALYRQFAVFASESSKGISRAAFDFALGPVSANLISNRLFSFFDSNSDGTISYEEFVRAMSVLCKGTLDERIRLAFFGCDLDGSGYITRNQLRTVLQGYFSLNIALVRDVVRGLEADMLAQYTDDAGKPVSAVFSAPIPSRMGDGGADGTEEDGDAEGRKKGDVEWQRVAGGGDGKSQSQPILEEMSQDAVEELVTMIMDGADTDGDDRLSLAEFTAFSRHDNTVLLWFDALGSLF